MLSKPIYIFVDDCRSCPEEAKNAYPTITVRTFGSAIELIRYFSLNGDKVIVDFDHDLGEEKTGYDIAKIIVAEQLPIDSYCVHSANPVGRYNITQLLDNYGYERRNFPW